jgi:hypothetical protein
MSVKQKIGTKMTTSEKIVRFSIIRTDDTCQRSRYVEAKLLDLNEKSMTLETYRVEVDGFHIAYNNSPIWKNRIHLQWNTPSGQSAEAVGETLWYEKISSSESKYLVALSLVEV